MNQPFLFLVGCGRSGTTLLTAMLDSHPDLAVPGESGGLVLRFCRRPPLAPEGDRPYSGAELERLLAELTEEHRYRLWDLDGTAVLAAAAQRKVATRPDFIRSVYLSYAEAHGKTRIGDKTPDHVLQLQCLSGLFPEARFVHLVRDGRDVALAMRDTSWGPKSIEEAAAHWSARVLRGRQDGMALGPDRYLEVRYETLVSEPERSLRQVCTFLQLEFQPSMLDFRAAAGRQLDMSPAPSEDASLLKPVSRRLRDWRAQMSRAEEAAFADVASTALETFGY